MDIRQIAQKTLDVLEKNRSRAAIGFLLLFFCSVGLMYFVLSGKTRQTPESQSVSTNIQVPQESHLRPRHLDGILVPTGEEAQIPFAVMIENHPDARPLSGLSKAQVVIEAPVEGGITRFMAIFDPSTEAEEIGPVRSARPYYVEWADSWHAFYAHVGGSPDGLALIRTKHYLSDLDQFRYGNTFWRSIQRSAPHNVYTNMTQLTEHATATPSSETELPLGWRFQVSTSGTTPGKDAEIAIPYGGSFDASWKFDAEQQDYIRYQNGSKQKDKDGSIVTAKNIVVIETETKVLDSKGRLKLRTAGEGHAIGFRNGEHYALTWSKTENGLISFQLDGNDYVLAPGTTWMEVVTDKMDDVRIKERVET